jgi:hypothetical protein
MVAAVQADDAFSRNFGSLRIRALQSNIEQQRPEPKPRRQNEEKGDVGDDTTTSKLTSSQRRIAHLRKLRQWRKKRHNTVISQIRTCASGVQVSLSQIEARANLEDMAFARRLQQQSQTASRRLQELLFECAGEIEKVRLRATLHSASSIPVFQANFAALERERAWTDILSRMNEDCLGAVVVSSLSSIGDDASLFATIRESIEPPLPASIRSSSHRTSDGNGNRCTAVDSGSSTNKARVLLVARVEYSTVRERSRAADGSICVAARPQSSNTRSNSNNSSSSGSRASSNSSNTVSKLSASTNIHSSSSSPSTADINILRCAVGSDAAKAVLGTLSRRAGIHVPTSRAHSHKGGGTFTSSSIATANNTVAKRGGPGPSVTSQYTRRQHSETTRLPTLPACKLLSARLLEWMVPYFCPADVVKHSSKPLLASLRVFYCVESRAQECVSLASSGSTTAKAAASRARETSLWNVSGNTHKGDPAVRTSAKVACKVARLLESIYCSEFPATTSPLVQEKQLGGTQSQRSWNKTEKLGKSFMLSDLTGSHRTLPTYAKALRHIQATCDSCLSSSQGTATKTRSKKRGTSSSSGDEPCSCVLASQRLIHFPDILIASPFQSETSATTAAIHHDRTQTRNGSLHFAPATVATLLESTQLSTRHNSRTPTESTAVDVAGGCALTDTDAVALSNNYGIDLKQDGIVRRLYVLVDTNTNTNTSSRKAQSPCVLIPLPAAAVDELIHAYILRSNVTVVRGQASQTPISSLREKRASQQQQQQLYQGHTGGHTSAPTQSGGTGQGGNSLTTPVDAVWLWPKVAHALKRAALRSNSGGNGDEETLDDGHRFGLALISGSFNEDTNETQSGGGGASEYLVAFETVGTKQIADNTSSENNKVSSAQQVPASRIQHHQQRQGLNHKDGPDQTSSLENDSQRVEWAQDGPGPLCAWRSCLSDADSLKHVAVDTNVVLAYAVCSHHGAVIERLVSMTGGLQEIKRHLGHSTGPVITGTTNTKRLTKKQQLRLQQQRQQSERDVFGLGSDRTLKGIISTSSLAHELQTHKVSCCVVDV